MSGAASATFVYDGDGQRVKATFGGVTTVYVGNYYEKQGSTVCKYYYAGGQRVAMRQGSTLYWLLGDHLGSTALTAYYSGGRKAELRYYPYGETRYTYGSTPTSLRFTGQREDATIGLYFYNARYYDPALGRFISTDTVAPNPGNPQDLNRYSYVRNSPLNYTDPSGHLVDSGGGGGGELLTLPGLGLQVAVVYGAAPGRERSPFWDSVSTNFDYAGMGLDCLESVISVAGAAGQGTVTLGGGALAQLEPTPAGEVLAVLVGVGVSVPADALEDVPGSFGVILDALGDWAGGNTYWDRSTNEMVIGQDTLLSSGTQLADFLIPSSIADVFLNGGELGYDLAKVRGRTSAFMEFRTPFDLESGSPDLGGGYLVLYPDAIEGAPAYEFLMQLIEALQ